MPSRIKVYLGAALGADLAGTLLLISLPVRILRFFPQQARPTW